MEGNDSHMERSGKVNEKKRGGTKIASLLLGTKHMTG